MPASRQDSTHAAFAAVTLFPTVAGLAIACSAAARPGATVLSGPTMGTRYTVAIAGASLDVAAEARARAAVDAELVLVDRLMSSWRDDSELARFNRQPAGRPFAASAPTVAVFAAALEVGRVSAGAFDVTVAPLVRTWGFGPGERLPAAPDVETLAHLRDAVGLDRVRVDPVRGTLTKAHDDVECDLSAIAPGYAADRVAGALHALGHNDVLVDVGGEIRASGRRADGQPWRVAIEHPQGGTSGFAVPLRDAALATSGDYRNAWVDAAGRTLSHVLDPRSGHPVDHALASVTVVRPTAMEADALATALLVLGPEAGPSLAERQGWAACFLVRRARGGLETRTTTAFSTLLGS
jgi:thiamine biosynthesis lipoprotein